MKSATLDDKVVELDEKSFIDLYLQVGGKPEELLEVIETFKQYENLGYIIRYNMNVSTGELGYRIIMKKPIGYLTQDKSLWLDIKKV